MISSVRIRMVKKRGGCKLADKGKEGLLPDSLLSRLSFTAFLFLSYCTLPRVLYICHRPRHPLAFRMLTHFFIKLSFLLFFWWVCLLYRLRAVLPVDIIYFPHQALFHLHDFPHIFPSITPHCPNICSTLVPARVCSEQKQKK